MGYMVSKNFPRRTNSPLRRHIDSLGLVQVQARGPTSHKRDQRDIPGSDAMMPIVPTEATYAHL